MQCRGQLLLGLCIFLWAQAVLGQEKTGTVQGVVRFTGTLPPVRPLPTGDGGTIQHQDLIVEAKSKGLSWVIVALEDAPAQPRVKDAEGPVVIDQKDFLFIPRVIAVPHGQPVRFDNSDNINHSVTIFPALKENELNVFVTAKDPVIKEFAAEKAPLRVGCALHPSMTAWIYVAAHPWVAVSDEKGAFAIKDVPPGKYKLLLRHPDSGLIERRDIAVTAGKKTEVEVEWKEVKRAKK